MNDEAGQTVKKSTRARKTISTPTVSPSIGSSKIATPSEEIFNDVVGKINEAKAEFIILQREILETRQSWEKEKIQYAAQLAEQNQHDQTEKKRENEGYEYEISKKRRIEQDEFLEKKTKWEKELVGQKEKIENDRKELENLRKLVDSFESEKEKAIKAACSALQQDLTRTFNTEKKLSEQEIKADKELLALKITTLTQENARQAKEIEVLKTALDNTTRQLKEVAVKVIESSSTRQVAPQES